MSEIDWRSMFKGVLSRMRDAGESNEMGARWMATEAEAAVYDLTAERDRLREALADAADKLEALLFLWPAHPLVVKARAALKGDE